MKRLLLGLFLMTVALLATGCYFNDVVDTDQVAAKIDGGQIKEVVGPGVQGDWGFFATLKPVSCNTITIPVSDDEVATADTQLVGISATIQVRRRCDPDSIKNLLTNWSTIASDDGVLTNTVTAIVAQGIKVGTRDFTLDQLLSDRTGLALKIEDAVKTQSDKFSVDVINTAVNNVKLSDSYTQILQTKANLQVQVETEQKRQDLINQQAANDKLTQDTRARVLAAQLLAEQAQTNVDVEIASREGKKIAAANQVYKDNPQAFALRQLELYQGIFNNKTVYFLPPNGNLNLLMGVGGQVVPTNVISGTTTTP